MAILEQISYIMCGHDGWLGFIHHTCVDKKFRGKKIGEHLVEAAITALKKEGINLVSLVVYSSNDDGNLFWEHMGFVRRDMGTVDDLIYRNKFLI